jgi:antitoxin component YwqK of YwqJK toxin-antitoxin module
MKSQITVLFCLFLSLAMLDSCKEKPAITKPIEQKIAFSIPNSNEEIISTHQDGSRKVAVFKDAVSNKKIAEVEFHKNGQPKINKRFENDSLNGESWCYYEDGKPWSLNTFKNGAYDGPYKTWFENGQLNIQGFYVNGKEEGDWVTYYPSGRLNTRGVYKNGQKVGVWSSYNSQGELRMEQDYSKTNAK